MRPEQLAALVAFVDDVLGMDEDLYERLTPERRDAVDSLYADADEAGVTPAHARFGPKAAS